MQKSIYIKIISILAVVLSVSYLTYTLVRAYDNFVAEVEKKGYDKGYTEAKKDIKLEAVSKSN